MLAKTAADITLLVHLAFILFVIFGGLLAKYRLWLAWFHIPMVLWASVVNLSGWICPLTPLENTFRVAAGQAGYAGGFVEHYVTRLVYPEGLSYAQWVILGISVLVWNMLIYTILVLQRKRGH